MILDLNYSALCCFDVQRGAAVAEWYRYRTVACFVTGSNPVPLKTRRVGQRCTLNLSRAETFSRWCGVVVRRGGVPAQVSSTSLDHGSKLRGPSPKSPRVAEQCDVNIQSINQLMCNGNDPSFNSLTCSAVQVYPLGAWHLTGNYSNFSPTTFCTTYGTANREDSHLLQHPIEVPYLTQQDRQSTERPQIKTDSPLLYEMTSLLLTSASPQMPPHQSPCCDDTLLKKARLLASYNELSRLHINHLRQQKNSVINIKDILDSTILRTQIWDGGFHKTQFPQTPNFHPLVWSPYKGASSGIAIGRTHRVMWTATAGSDVVQSGRPIFDNFFQHLWPYIGSNTANVVFQIVKRLWLIRIDQ
ncbi:uncharacterized protein TNCV_2397111 [Trichonephila clavipes]|uniref:Uncharacterized protein n=1 Tax=Trichonephila clavipes TaxID=2585209 RepID=A0A8X6VM68_TRICX|nr:uncharacterized protein TNCV_2397111 [Trichonephila clavipes]